MQNSSEYLERCRLARAVRADQRNRFALFDTDTDAIDRLNFRNRAPKAVPLRQDEVFFEPTNIHSTVHTDLQTLLERLDPGVCFWIYRNSGAGWPLPLLLDAHRGRRHYAFQAYVL